MDLFDGLLGNESLKKALRHALRTRLPQTILLTGPVGIGKWTLAHMLAAALVCEEEQHAPCGHCLACRKAQQQLHPDIVAIDEQEREIKVETARQLRRDASVLPSEARSKVFLIRHAHQMNASAQNALLKLLEEPPSYAFFVLTAENPGGLLPTILSRCTQFALSPLPKEELLPLLRTRFPDKEEEYYTAAAAVSQGIAGEALHTLEQEDNQAAQLAAPVIRALVSRDELALFRAANACAGLTRPQFIPVLNTLELALRDAVFAGRGLAGTMLPALQEETKALAGQLSTRRLLELYRWMQELRRRADRNAGMALLTGCLAARCYEIVR